MPAGPRSRGLAGTAVVSGAAAAFVAALVGWAEWHTWRASRDAYPDNPAPRPDAPSTPRGRDVVLVLGFRSPARGGTNLLQRWRIAIAVRSAPPGALFLFSGAAVHGSRPEAEAMAAHAVAAHGVDPADVALETRATTTRENLRFALPWLREASTVRIASNTFHARRARRYLRTLDPAVFARLRPTRDFVPLELGPLRLALTAYDAAAATVAARRDRADDGGSEGRELSG